LKFLLNENVSPVVAQALIDLGHDVSMASDHPGSPDTYVLTAASNQERILITCDKGFGALVHRDRMAHAGVVILRLRMDTPEYQRAVLLAAIHDGRLSSGCFLTLTDADRGGEAAARP
jgi:predicted nuclease of predicted toxin-antitoxin system